MKDIPYFLETKISASLISKNKTDKATEYLEICNEIYLETISNMTTYPPSMWIWNRKGDDIIIDMSKPYKTQRLIVVYNVKTKKRFAFYASKNNNLNVNIVIPSLKICESFLSASPFYKSDYNMQTLILKQPIADIFKGTNVEIFINNPDISLNNIYPYSDSENEKIISDNFFNIAILATLLTSGIPVYELTLKSGLYNLYSVLISDSSRTANDYDKICQDIDKNTADYRNLITFHGKGKNLSKIFGYNIRLLRIIDKHINTQGSRINSTFPAYELVRQMFDCDPNCLDNTTFESLIQINVNSKRSYNWETISQVLSSIKGKPIEKIEKIKPYMDDLTTYRDYLRMRSRIINNIDALSHEHGINLNMSAYPVCPGKAIRFIPYRPNINKIEWIPYSIKMKHNLAYGNLNLSNKDHFKIYYQYTYGDRCKIIYNEYSGDLEGALCEFNIDENVLFLHDDINQWADMVKNECLQKDFTKATERIKDLAYINEDMGLQIMIPEHVNEIQEEGNILHHCVASYIQPICDGSENIVFLRRIDMPDHPFYTIEVLNDGSIRQVHCFRNGDLTEDGQIKAYESSTYEVYNKTFDIIKFLKLWAKACPRIQSSSITNRYGALCAIR